MFGAIIVEKGNGFPDVGDYVPGKDGYLYKVVSMNSNIHTGFTSGNWLFAKVEPASWQDCPEGTEHSSQVIFN